MKLLAATMEPPRSGWLSIHILADATGFTPTFLRRCVKHNRFNLRELACRESGSLLFKISPELRTFIDQQRARRAHLTKHTQTELP